MLYINNVQMLTILENTNSEMGLRNNAFILFCLICLEFQDLVSAKIVKQ